MFIISCKQVSPLIVLSINAPKPTRGLDALSNCPPWKGKNLSSGGRLILTNSSLSSIPIYSMGMYRLCEENHHKMDTIRSQFFWRGAGNNFKYHMIRWNQLCLPKDFGGIGILNTRLLNDALLLKWVWRILAQRTGDLCCQLLRAKYLHNKTLMNNKNRTRSQFWKGIQTVKHKIRFGLAFKVHNGRDTIFLDDVWLTNVPLRLDFLEIYIKCRKKNAWVRDLWDGEA